MRELQFDECLVYLPVFSHQYLILEKYAESILKNVDQMVSIVSHFHPRRFPGWLFCSFQMGSSHQLSVNVCPKKGNTPTFLFFSDGIGTQKILFDREGSGFLGYIYTGYSK